METKYVFYEDFGAVGDGVTDDSEAIRRAHDYANKNGGTVCAGEGKCYYIPPLDKAIEIMTDTDWKDARFTIDDRDIPLDSPRRTTPLFKVISAYAPTTLDVQNCEAIVKINNEGGVNARSCTKLDIGLGYPAMLKVVNADHKNYIRHGANKNSGSAQMEVVVIDKDGNLDPTTPFLFDYEKITSVVVYNLSEPAITLNGGVFTTRAHQADSAPHYVQYLRNFYITRSNVTVQNLTHYVTDEREGKYSGNPYCAFLYVNNAANVLFENCIFTGHKTYYCMGSGGSEVGMGTYDTDATTGTNVVWRNCKQTNFFLPDGVTLDDDKWGVMSSSYTKNLTYENCELTRFDAHAGVYNAKIINSKIVDFRITGGGELVIENTHVYKNLLISLREDYGAFWHGNIVLKDVTMHNSGDVNLVAGAWYNHDFGYPTEFPREIVIDNLRLTSEGKVNVFSEKFISQTKQILQDKVDTPVRYKNDAGEWVTEIRVMDNENPTKPIQKLVIKNNDADLEFILPDANEYPFFADMKIEK